MRGDVLDESSVEAAMRGQEAVLCALGHNPTRILSEGISQRSLRITLDSLPQEFRSRTGNVADCVKGMDPIAAAVMQNGETSSASPKDRGPRVLFAPACREQMVLV